MNHRDAAALRTAPSAQAEAVAVAAKPDTPHPRADPFTWRCPRTLERSRRSAFETLQPVLALAPWQPQGCLHARRTAGLPAVCGFWQKSRPAQAQSAPAAHFFIAFLPAGPVPAGPVPARLRSLQAPTSQPIASATSTVVTSGVRVGR